MKAVAIASLCVLAVASVRVFEFPSKKGTANTLLVFHSRVSPLRVSQADARVLLGGNQAQCNQLSNQITQVRHHWHAVCVCRGRSCFGEVAPTKRRSPDRMGACTPRSARVYGVPVGHTRRSCDNRGGYAELQGSRRK
jgi:hypothetical protein